MRRFARRPSPAMLVALTALFVALGGTSYAAVTLPRNSVGPLQLKNGAVVAKKLRNRAVTPIKVNKKTIALFKGQTGPAGPAGPAGPQGPQGPAGGPANISDGSITTAKLADGAVTTPKLADGAVTSTKIGNGQVRAADLGTLVEVSNSVSIASGASGTVTANCASGTVVISGGAQPANFGVEMTSSKRSGNGWLYQAKNNSGAASTLKVYAYCLSS